jgi:hypothetical protein
LTARVSGVGWVRLANQPCVERPARRLRGPCAFDLCCDPAGPLAFRPGRPGPSSADRAETDLVDVEITIRRDWFTPMGQWSSIQLKPAS